MTDRKEVHNLAKYSDNREWNVEASDLYRVWSRVDSRIELPPGLRADALLPLLEDPPENAPVSRKSRFRPRVFTWQSGVTYAAAFVLVVAVSAVLTRGNPTADIVAGQLEPVPYNEEQTASAPTMEAGMPLLDDSEPAPAAPAADTAQQEQTAAAALRQEQQPSAGAGGEAGDASVPAGDRAAAAAYGIGGEGASIELGQDELYTYTYRLNDETDPDKAGIPITVTVTHTATGVLAFPIDIVDMYSIEEHFVFNNTLTLVGAGGSGVVLRTYDLTQVGAPTERLAIEQPGRYLDARLHKNVVNLFTLLEQPEDPGCEVVALPGAVSDMLCVVSAVDVESGLVEQKAFAGAGDDVSLLNLNAYIKYEGEPDEEHPEGHYVAQIRLDGMSIELGSIA